MAVPSTPLLGHRAASLKLTPWIGIVVLGLSCIAMFMINSKLDEMRSYGTETELVSLPSAAQVIKPVLQFLNQIAYVCTGYKTSKHWIFCFILAGQTSNSSTVLDCGIAESNYCPYKCNAHLCCGQLSHAGINRIFRITAMFTMLERLRVTLLPWAGPVGVEWLGSLRVIASSHVLIHPWE